MVASQQLITALQAQSEQAQSDAASRQDELSKLTAARDSAAQNALQLLDVAQRLVTPETSREDRNSLILRQCQVYLLTGRYDEAAVLGQFLLEHFPSIAGTKDAAVMAMRADAQLLEQAPTDDRQFETEHLASICESIIHTWPGEAGAEDAAQVLVAMAIQNSDMKRALKLLDTMQKGSSQRAKFEIIIGRLTWAEYQKRAAQDSANTGPDEELLQQAESLLSSGLSAFTSENVTRNAAFGALNLAQVYLERHEVEKAITQLETATVAPLDLIKQKLPAAADADFVISTYRTALRAYIAGMHNGDQVTALVDKAQNVVAALRDMLAEGADGSDKIVAVYKQLARELLDQFDRIRSPQDKDSFSQSLAVFMRSIQENTTDAKTLLWIGSTLNSVADGLAADGLEQNARTFRGQTIKALDAAQKSGFHGDPNADDLMLELKRQKALAMRGQRNFSGSVDLFAEILKSKPGLISAQVDAAQTLQQQADVDKSATRFAEAASGARENIVWGWRKIAQATRGKEPFSDIFFDAVYNLAYCQFRYGEIQNRTDAKQAALRTLLDQHSLFPELGGNKNKNRYNELAKQIQTSLDQTASGLQSANKR